MQTLRIILASGLALALSGISILCCFEFGRHLAPGQEGQIYGVLGGVADALKAVLPIGIAAAWVSRERARAMVGGALFMVFASYSFASELGLYALGRDAQAGNTLAGKESLDLIKADRARIQERLKALGQTRPAAQIEADRAAARQSRLWTQSAECKEATGAARTFCADYEKLQGELAASTEAEKLRTDDAKLSQKLSGIDLSAALRSGDPQSEALARFTGFAPATIRDALAILVALLIELGSGFGLWVATAGAGRTDSKGSSGATQRPERKASQRPSSRPWQRLRSGLRGRPGINQAREANRSCEGLPEGMLQRAQGLGSNRVRSSPRLPGLGGESEPEATLP